MRTVTECKQFADECRKAALKMRDPQDKQRLQEMAAVWEKLALDQERETKAAPRRKRSPRRNPGP